MSDKTHGYYADHVRLHIDPAIGGTQLRRINAMAVQAFYGQLLAGGTSRALASKIGTTLSVALGAAVRLGLIVGNPARDVRKPKGDKPEMTVLTGEQIRTFLAAAESDRLYALYVVAVDSGARMGELLGIQWGDIDFDSGAMTIRRSLRELKGKLTLGPPKTLSSRRRIVLTAFAVAVLNGHRARMLADGHYRPDGPVFPNNQGGHLDRCNLWKSFQAILERAGLKFRFHDLRHACATQLLAAGEGVKVVSERLGHASSAMTLNVYAHVLEGAQSQAAAKLDAILRPRVETRKSL